MIGLLRIMTTHLSQSDLETPLQTAQHIAEGAEQILLQGFGKVTSSQKADGSLVTQTDQDVDEFITTQLAVAFPDHAVLSEERNTIYDPSVDFTWVIDPLDGTTNFARGLPIWGVSIALLFMGVPIVGVLRFPLLREEYCATLRGGAFQNNLPIQTASNTKSDSQHFYMLCTRTPRRYHISTQLKPRILGSAAYHLAAVANGSALAGIEATPKLWDFAAPLLILSEAGGCHHSLEDSSAIFPLDVETRNYERVSIPLLVAANSAIMSEMEMNIAKR